MTAVYTHVGLPGKWVVTWGGQLWIVPKLYGGWAHRLAYIGLAANLVPLDGLGAAAACSVARVPVEPEESVIARWVRTGEGRS